MFYKWVRMDNYTRCVYRIPASPGFWRYKTNEVISSCMSAEISEWCSVRCRIVNTPVDWNVVTIHDRAALPHVKWPFSLSIETPVSRFPFICTCFQPGAEENLTLRASWFSEEAVLCRLCISESATANLTIGSMILTGVPLGVSRPKFGPGHATSIYWVYRFNLGWSLGICWVLVYAFYLG